MKTENLSPFVLGYITAALWTEDNGAPSGDYVETGRAREQLARVVASSLKEALADCADFQEANMAQLAIYYQSRSVPDAGHDFWLTRNGHGAGFWDRGLGDCGKALSDAAKVYGETYLERYKGRIYFR